VSDPASAIRPPAVGDASFDEYYYAHCCGDPYDRSEPLLRFFGGIADRLVADVAPKTVLDAGCAIGLLVEALRQRGVEATGIDLSSYAIGRVDEAVRAYCRQGSIADEFPERYDLIVSIEVLEHMPVRAAEAAIANFCRHTDDVLFSSSPLDYKEPTHINVHPTEYWAAEFARHGFYRDVDFDASYITPWATRFRRSAEPLHRVVRNYERRFWELTLERNDTRTYSMQVQNDLAERIRRATELERAAADAGAERDAIKAQADALRADLETARTEIETSRTALAAAAHAAAATAADLRAKSDALAVREAETAHLGTALHAAEVALAEARDRIAHMERSVFWRIRTLIRGSRGH
jgi:SAM-dependent methyltransferase